MNYRCPHCKHLPYRSVHVMCDPSGYTVEYVCSECLARCEPEETDQLNAVAMGLAMISEDFADYRHERQRYETQLYVYARLK